MKKTLLTLALIGICNITFGQAFDWVKQLGGTSFDAGRSVVVDKNNNVITTGYFAGISDFDPGPNVFNLNGGSGSTFISKLDSNGNFIWAKVFRAVTVANEGHSITADTNNNIYVTGNFEGTTDFNPGSGVFNITSTPGGTDVYVCKLNANGNFVWAKSFTGIADDRGEAIHVDNNGNVYSTGQFGGTADFNPGSGTYNLTANGNLNIFISKLDNNGNFLWARRFGSVGADNNGVGIKTDVTGNVYTTGFFEGVVDFDPGSSVFNLSSNGLTDIFVIKLNSLGNLIWAKNMGGTSQDRSFDLDLDDNNNVYTAGFFFGTSNFDPNSSTANLTSAGSYDCFISKLDNNGNYKWVKQISGPSLIYLFSLTTDDEGSVYAGGAFNGTVDFNPGAGISNGTSNGGPDGYNLKLDSNGSYIWSNQFGNPIQDAVFSIAVDNNKDVYSVGQFMDSVDFDPSSSVFYLQSYGSLDAFVLKNFGCKSPPTTFVVNDCDSTSINGVKYYNTGLYTQSFTNAMGCDSNINYQVIIHNSTVSNITLTQCDSLLFGNQLITSSGNYAHNFQGQWGCDSVVNLTATINNSSMNTITQSGCDSLIINGQTYTNSGTYNQILSNSQSCDSILTLNLSISQSSSNTISQSACNQLVLNGQTYTSSGAYTQLLTNNQGCDSTLNINVTIFSIDTTVNLSGITLIANQNGATYQWLNCENNTVISGATGQSYTPNANGSYAVIINLNGCIDTSFCTPVLTIRTKDIADNELFKIIPNPNNGRFVLLADKISNANLKLFNSFGGLVYTEDNVTFEKKEINIEKLAKGVYLLELRSKENIYRYKIIKE